MYITKSNIFTNVHYNITIQMNYINNHCREGTANFPFKRPRLRDLEDTDSSGPPPKKKAKTTNNSETGM